MHRRATLRGWSFLALALAFPAAPAQARGSNADAPVVAPGFCIQKIADVTVRDIAWGPGGDWGTDLYASSENSIIRIAADGTVSTLVSGLAAPSGIAFASGGAFGHSLYVALLDADSIVRVSASGAVASFATFPASPGIDPIDLLFGPGEAGYTADLYATDLGGCGCAPGRIFRFDARGAWTVVSSDFGTSPTGLGIARGGEFGDATVLAGDVANGAFDDGAFWTLPPSSPPIPFLYAPTTVFVNPVSIVQGIGGSLGTDLYLGDLGLFVDPGTSFFVKRRAENGSLTDFLSGLHVASYTDGRLRLSPAGDAIATNSSTAVYRIRPASAGDLDHNGHVDAADLAILLGAWGQAGSAADLDCDGSVGAADLAILLGTWG